MPACLPRPAGAHTAAIPPPARAATAANAQPPPDEVGPAGRDAIHIGLAGRGEVVHLVVQQQAWRQGGGGVGCGSSLRSRTQQQRRPGAQAQPVPAAAACAEHPLAPVEGDSTLLPNPVFTVVVSDTAILQRQGEQQRSVDGEAGRADAACCGGRQPATPPCDDLLSRPAAAPTCSPAAPVCIHHRQVGGAVVLGVHAHGCDVEGAAIGGERQRAAVGDGRPATGGGRGGRSGARRQHSESPASGVAEAAAAVAAAAEQQKQKRQQQERQQRRQSSGSNSSGSSSSGSSSHATHRSESMKSELFNAERISERSTKGRSGVGPGSPAGPEHRSRQACVGQDATTRRQKRQHLPHPALPAHATHPGSCAAQRRASAPRPCGARPGCRCPPAAARSLTGGGHAERGS